MVFLEIVLSSVSQVSRVSASLLSLSTWVICPKWDRREEDTLTLKISLEIVVRSSMKNRENREKVSFSRWRKTCRIKWLKPLVVSIFIVDSSWHWSLPEAQTWSFITALIACMLSLHDVVLCERLPLSVNDQSYWPRVSVGQQTLDHRRWETIIEYFLLAVVLLNSSLNSDSCRSRFHCYFS